MNYLIAFMLCFASLSLAAQDESSLNWFTNLEEAQKVSKKEKKPILVYFTGSDWYAPCKMLKEDFFASNEFKKKATEVVLVLIDYPRRIDIITQAQLEYNKTIIEKYNPEKTFPKLLGLNFRGKELGEISGYSPLRDTTHHFKFLEKISL